MLHSTCEREYFDDNLCIEVQDKICGRGYAHYEEENETDKWTYWDCDLWQQIQSDLAQNST